MFFIDTEDCSACDACIDACPCDAISVVDGHHVINPDLCVECGACYDVCEFGAIFEADAPLGTIPKKDV